MSSLSLEYSHYRQSTGAVTVTIDEADEQRVATERANRAVWQWLLYSRPPAEPSRSSLNVGIMPRLKFSIKRLMLGTAFVALPFATFGGFGENGIVVSIVIAVPMFISSCIASRDQLQSMFGIIGFTTLGLITGTIVSPVVGRRYDVAMHENICAMFGCAIGLFWSENFYAGRLRARLAREFSERHRLSVKSNAVTNNGENPSPH